MNCVPGDLAIIINGLDNGKEHVGKVIRVTALNSILYQCWNYEGERLFAPSGAEIASIEDEALRPLRGDVTDKEVQELYSLPVPERMVSL